MSVNHFHISLNLDLLFGYLFGHAPMACAFVGEKNNTGKEKLV